MYVIVFNGPPYSGKDTLAQMVLEHIESQMASPPPTKLESLSLPLREIAYKMVGLTYNSDDPDEYDRFKRARFALGGVQPAPTTLAAQYGITGRQLMIDVSEKFLKMCYGREIMAQLLIQRNANMPDNSILLIRDGGFQIEVNPLADWVGFHNLMVVRIHRPEYSFVGDSREYVSHPIERMNMDIVNDSDFDHLRTEAGRLYGRLVNSRGWKL